MYALLALAATAGLGRTLASPASGPELSEIVRRQNNADSTCQVFGLDFQDGGSYFLNSNSSQNFMASYQFRGCNDAIADVMLVNMNNGDQYFCSSVSTVPDNSTQVSTCPVQHSQLTTANYSIITLGNNGKGNPFAVQRDFVLNVRRQETSTVTISMPATVTSNPINTVTKISVVTTTSTVVPNQTPSSSPSSFGTAQPPTQTITQTDRITQTFTRWTETDTTSTHVVQKNNCFVLGTPKQDAPCTTLPAGLKNGFGPKIRKRELNMPDPGFLEKRAPDPQTVTTTTTVPNGSTQTLTGEPSTTTVEQQSTATALTTVPASNGSSAAQTTQAPSVQVETVKSYVVAYITKTMTISWRTETTIMPTGLPTPCNAPSQGGGASKW
ncbi:hypothetical protein KC343_g3657 [Hortaea werneckii]|uniref:Uncharacterized protein n=1 Tax=Hortaea werneckii TaxID=91943 RepID=A0A3M7H359_HORWE|nr:hypothetical protein KC352_g12042 [Hortaea werneckii]KAI7568853.1 hypothetical protein KC317_g3823 [Hortaea werneckii]KAI7622089.1 hypothetical protein KC346_g3373 [Hortaea werneckii]KAI7632099.1 hypothetical protein KC343_g3657 [Hortaea werneckii]KAI7667939.1 hypothetical protein KC319_g6544 [Hortaea werneckii]